MKPITRQCERAREYASLRLDGELSEFEQALLGAHLARCEPCRSFADELESLTDHMRATPLARLEQPVSLPARRRLVSSAAPVEIAAAAARHARRHSASPVPSGRSRRPTRRSASARRGARRTPTPRAAPAPSTARLAEHAPGSATAAARRVSAVRRPPAVPASSPRSMTRATVRLRRVRLARHLLRLSARPCRQVGGRVRATRFHDLGAGALR